MVLFLLWPPKNGFFFALKAGGGAEKVSGAPDPGKYEDFGPPGAPDPAKCEGFGPPGAPDTVKY